jgi:hypothetical protein
MGHLNFIIKDASKATLEVFKQPDFSLLIDFCCLHDSLKSQALKDFQGHLYLKVKFLRKLDFEPV